jgi:steroid 5-alpha reductase family enzyme
VVVIAGNCLAYLFCQVKKDNSYIDVIWGLTFVTPIAALIILYLASG